MPHLDVDLTQLGHVAEVDDDGLDRGVGKVVRADDVEMAPAAVLVPRPAAEREVLEWPREHAAKILLRGDDIVWMHKIKPGTAEQFVGRKSEQALQRRAGIRDQT